MPATPVTWLDEFTVNLTTTGNQIAPVITQLTNGNIVVVWQSDNDTGVGSPSGTDLIGQIFDPLGNRIGLEFLANPGASLFAETTPAITALPDGGFAIAFERNEPGYRDIILQTFNLNGAAAVSRSAFLDATANTLSDGFDPVIASSSANSILTVWRLDEVGGDSGIYGRIYNPVTDTSGSQFSLIDTALAESDPVVTVLNNGNYVIACLTDLVGSDSEITLRIIDSTGANVLGAVAVPGTGAAEREPAITALEGGGFVVSWTRPEITPQNFIEFQIYTDAGLAVGSVVQVTSFEDYEQSVVVALPDGGFIVAWDDDFTSTASLSAQRYDLNGAAVGSVFAFAPGAALANLDAVALEDGRIALTFTRADGEIGMEILDVRDAPTTGGYTPDIQIGTIGNDTFSGDGAADSVYGHDGNDVITVAGTANQYFGGEGDDTINPTDGVIGDRLYGGNGIDLVDWSGFSGSFDFNLATGFATNQFGFAYIIDGFENLTGGSGNDVITGSTETNRLVGGGGNDTIFGGLGADDSLYGGLGNDSITSDGDGGTYEGNEGNDTLVSGDGAESMYGGADIDTIDHRGVDIDYEFYMETGQTNVIDEAFEGFEIAFMGDGSDSVLGTANADTIYGGAGEDFLIGEGGNDSLSGGLGADYFRGGAGNDTFDGGNDDAETDYVSYEGSGPVLAYLELPAINSGDAAGDVYIGVEGLIGGGGADFLGGDSGANHLIGGGGNDALQGDFGDDLLDGGTGNDDFFGGAGGDILIGGAGFDRAIYVGTVGIQVDLANISLNTGEAAGDAYFSIEGVRGAGSNDTLAGNALANELAGQGGNDILEGRGGNDTLFGNNGNDTFISAGSDGADVYDGGDGNDVVDFSTASQAVFIDQGALATGNENAAFGDTFTSIEGYIGSAFDDLFITGSGNDSLYGGNGNDIFAAGSGIDLIDGGNGPFDGVSFYLSATGVTVDLANGGLNTGEAAGDTYLSIELFEGSLHNDMMSGDNGANDLDGIDGNDVLQGRGGADRLVGNDGNDTILGGAGADQLIGGDNIDLAAYWDSATGLRVDLQVTANNTGIAVGDTFSGIENLAGTNLNDTLNGDSGNNVIIGFNGSDVIESRAGNDTLDGGEGNDTIGGGLGADSLLGGNGRDLAFFWDSTAAGVTARLDILGGNTGFATGDVFNGIEDIAGTNFADVLVGDATGNTLLGSGGNDTLFGNAGNDTLQGGAGNDSIYGMAGNDLLAGEAGQDSFVFEGSMGATNVDRIIDFSSVDDTIVLENALFTTLANGNLAANQVAFGAAATLGTHRVIYNSATGQLFYDADGLGGTAQVHLATLNPGVVLALADFFVI